MNGVPLFNKRYAKWYTKGKELDLGTESLRIKFCRVPPLPYPRTEKLLICFLTPSSSPSSTSFSSPSSSSSPSSLPVFSSSVPFPVFSTESSSSAFIFERSENKSGEAVYLKFTVRNKVARHDFSKFNLIKPLCIVCK